MTHDLAEIGRLTRFGSAYWTDDRLCGARTRGGASCRLPKLTSRSRCRLHGGRSTGPRTAEGMAAMRRANTVHGWYAGPGHPYLDGPGGRWRRRRRRHGPRLKTPTDRAGTSNRWWEQPRDERGRWRAKPVEFAFSFSRDA